MIFEIHEIHEILEIHVIFEIIVLFAIFKKLKKYLIVMSFKQKSIVTTLSVFLMTITANSQNCITTRTGDTAMTGEATPIEETAQTENTPPIGEFDLNKYIIDAYETKNIINKAGSDVEKADAIKAFNDKYLTCTRGTSLTIKPHWLYPDDVYYGDNSATANLMALNLGLVPDDCHDEVLKNLITNIIRLNGGHFKGSEEALPILLQTLSAEGRSDVANLLTQRDSALLSPFTAQWRREVIAGISPVKEGSNMVRLKPDFSIAVLEDLDESYDSPKGPVRSRWHKDLMHAEWDLTVPEGMEAEITIPGSSRKHVKGGSGVKFLRQENGATIWKAKGGERHFSIDFDMPEHIVAQQFLFERHNFPTCHSSSITQLSNGDMLAVFSGGKNEAAIDTRIYMTRKAKGCDSWSPFEEMSVCAQDRGKKFSTSNPVVFQKPDGEVLLFYHTSETGEHGTPCYLRRSSDLGYSWSEEERLPDGVQGPERAQPLILGDRMICPGDAHRKYIIRPLFSITEDGGRNWKTVGPSSAEYSIAANNRKPGKVGENFDVPADGFPRERAFEILASIQPAILVHRNGMLQALTRTCHSKLGCVWSYDGGLTWGHEYLTDFPNNNSGFTAITLKDGRFAMVCNDFESIPGSPRWEHMNARTPLSLFISEDGQLWTKVMDIEDGPIHNNAFPSGYCYPNMIEGDDGCLHLVYTWQRRRIKYVRIKL